jgi:hypothetical protein
MLKPKTRVLIYPSKKIEFAANFTIRGMSGYGTGRGGALLTIDRTMTVQTGKEIAE